MQHRKHTSKQMEDTNLLDEDRVQMEDSEECWDNLVGASLLPSSITLGTNNETDTCADDPPRFTSSAFGHLFEFDNKLEQILGTGVTEGDFFSVVNPARFPSLVLRFRNDALLREVFGIEDPQRVITDSDFLETFGEFLHFQQGPKQLRLALAYHGWQFGVYNKNLGDGRSFLWAQVREPQHRDLLDIGTKGSGKTPYSRAFDGKLTLKSGVREVLAGELLHHYGVRTSRCLCLIETGEMLYREDSNSNNSAADPDEETSKRHRGCVLVRVCQSLVRFGSFERLHHMQRPDLIKELADYVIDCYYTTQTTTTTTAPVASCKYSSFYLAVVKRVAELVAQWTSVLFVHGVLNTDNMSIAGEGIDYGPFAFLDTYNPRFAVPIDRHGRYNFGNQLAACRWNLEALQRPLIYAGLLTQDVANECLQRYEEYYVDEYTRLMMRRLYPGLNSVQDVEVYEGNELREGKRLLVDATMKLLERTQVDYWSFFEELRSSIGTILKNRRIEGSVIDMSVEDELLSGCSFEDVIQCFAPRLFQEWKHYYVRVLNDLCQRVHLRIAICTATTTSSSTTTPYDFDTIWSAIEHNDDWKPFQHKCNDLTMDD